MSEGGAEPRKTESHEVIKKIWLTAERVGQAERYEDETPRRKKMQGQMTAETGSETERDTRRQKRTDRRSITHREHQYRL